MKCTCDRARLIGTYSSHSGKRTCDTRCQEHEIWQWPQIIRRYHKPTIFRKLQHFFQPVIRWNFVCLYGYLFYLFILKMKYFFSKTFLVLEIVILTMTSWHEKELFTYLEVANCCVKQCVNKKKYNLFISFSAFLETFIAYKTSISGGYSLFNNFQEWKLLYSCDVV